MLRDVDLILGNISLKLGVLFLDNSSVSSGLVRLLLGRTLRPKQNSPVHLDSTQDHEEYLSKMGFERARLRH